MKQRYKIVIILILVGIAIPVSFIPFSYFSMYLANLEYVSNLPTVDVIGVIEFEKDGSFGFDYKLFLETEAQKELKFESVYLEYKNMNQGLIGQKIRVAGSFEDDYQEHLMLRGSDFSIREIVPVIFVKEIEILN
jgi:hypothetical protein